jgi:hypothetical protein
MLAAVWTCDTAADLLWALMATEPLERLLRDRHWSPEQYEAQLVQLLRSTLVAGSLATPRPPAAESGDGPTRRR